MSQSGGREFEVSTGDQARETTELFNAFHDGFIRRLTVLSHDVFEDIASHRVTGPLDLEIEFAHYNYDWGETPAERRIQARFTGVRNLLIAFTGSEPDWPITNFEMDEAEAGAFCEARLLQPRYADGEWSHAQAMSFSFESGVFTELPDDPGTLGS